MVCPRFSVRRRKASSLGSLLLVFVLWASSEATSNAGIKQTVVMGGDNKLCVPVENILGSGVFNWLYGLMGLDNTASGFNFVFSGEDAAKNIEYYHSKFKGVDLELTGTVSDVSNADSLRDRKIKSPYEDLWYGKGVYSGRVVEYDSESDLYIVRHSKNSRNWDIFKMRPDPQRQIPADVNDYWIASCNVGRRFDDGTILSSCMSGFVKDGVSVRFEYSGQQPVAIRKIRDFLFLQLEYWSGCEDE